MPSPWVREVYCTPHLKGPIMFTIIFCLKFVWIQHWTSSEEALKIKPKNNLKNNKKGSAFQSNFLRLHHFNWFVWNARGVFSHHRAATRHLQSFQWGRRFQPWQKDQEAVAAHKNTHRFCPTAQSLPCWTVGGSHWTATNHIEGVGQSGWVDFWSCGC